MQLCQVLKKVANAGASVLFTIHQPSSEIFQSFDHLILMNKGRVMYQGSVSSVPDFFARCGHPNPPNYNPAGKTNRSAPAHYSCKINANFACCGYRFPPPCLSNRLDHGKQWQCMICCVQNEWETNAHCSIALLHHSMLPKPFLSISWIRVVSFLKTTELLVMRLSPKQEKMNLESQSLVARTVAMATKTNVHPEWEHRFRYFSNERLKICSVM